MLIKPLTLIINQSISTGIFPNKLKLAKIIPVYKKDYVHDIQNYRPISLLPSVSKIFEKAVYDQLVAYLNTNNYLCNNQYGFRAEHSTEHAILELIDRVTLALDRGFTPIAIYLDLSKAFDSLNSEILLFKLYYYGARGSTFRWFETYLENRQHYVEFNNCTSAVATTSFGVPQGSILGPLLFTIYVNDLDLSSTFFNFVKYADDTTLLHINNDITCNEQVITNVNKELDNVYKWLCANQLSLNINKTKYMIFHNRGKKIDNIPRIQLRNILLEKVQTFSFLGVHINENLNWNHHIDTISLKLSRTLGILSKLKHYLPLPTLKIIYHSLFESHITYGILAWGNNTNRLFKLQKKAIRLISNSKYNAHTSPLFKTLNCLKIDDIYVLNILKFYFKFCHRKLPEYLLSFDLTARSNIHSHDTRASCKLITPKFRTKMADKCIRMMLPKVINSTSFLILQKIYTHSYQGFIWYIKQSILNDYSYVCTIQDCFVCAQ